jgi:hypothetical protein
MDSPTWVQELGQFTKRLFHQGWATVLVLFGLISTASTYVPAFYSRYAVPRWVPLLLFVCSICVAAFKVYLDERRRYFAELSRFESRVAELGSRVVELSVRSYDQQKLAEAKRMTEGYTRNQRDLLRYILTHGNPTTSMIARSVKPPLDQYQYYRQDVEPLEQWGILVRDSSKNASEGINRLFVAPAWVEVFKDVLFPRRENIEPPAYG